MAKVSAQDWLPLKEAARQLGENTETTRLRFGQGELRGEQRGRGRRWFVEPQSLAKLVAARGGGRGPEARIEVLEAKVDSLETALRHLSAHLDAAGRESSDLESVLQERDHYRAEASALREVAIRANAAQRSMADGFRRVLDAVEQNADAMTEVLGPRNVSDLLGYADPAGERREPDRVIADAVTFWGG